MHLSTVFLPISHSQRNDRYVEELRYYSSFDNDRFVVERPPIWLATTQYSAFPPIYKPVLDLVVSHRDPILQTPRMSPIP